MAIRRALVLVAGLSSTSCGMVYDFNDYQGLPGAGSGGGGVGGSGGSSGPGTGGSGVGGSGGSGGSGGMVSCNGIDFTQDPQHCGACGVACDGGACNNGVCTPVEANLTKDGRMVATLGDRVFVVRSDMMSAELVLYPVNYTSTDSPLNTTPVCDGNGFLSAGVSRVYYRPQNAGDACDTTYEYVHSCDTAFSCALTKYTVPNHINGVVAVGSDFYYMQLEGTMHKDTLSPEGVPAETNPTPVVVEGMVEVKGGTYLLSYDLKRDALWWTTFEGCVYKALRTDLPISLLGCSGHEVPSVQRLIISPNDKFYVGSTQGGIYAMDPEAVVPAPVPAFGPPGLRLLAADGDYVYAYDPASPAALVALRHGSAVERARLPMTFEVINADAQHSKYVFFVAGTSLYRWRKPAP
ncbi:MAG TPA: hypothetical protein VK459_17795 [Polyangiaceae bacterium]|nr:hypothetical protein [Polyangiaceae bacterium]